MKTLYNKIVLTSISIFILSSTINTYSMEKEPQTKTSPSLQELINQFYKIVGDEELTYISPYANKLIKFNNNITKIYKLIEQLNLINDILTKVVEQKEFNYYNDMTPQAYMKAGSLISKKINHTLDKLNNLKLENQNESYIEDNKEAAIEDTKQSKEKFKELKREIKKNISNTLNEYIKNAKNYSEGVLEKQIANAKRDFNNDSSDDFFLFREKNITLTENQRNLYNEEKKIKTNWIKEMEEEFNQISEQNKKIRDQIIGEYKSKALSKKIEVMNKIRDITNQKKENAFGQKRFLRRAYRLKK